MSRANFWAMQVPAMRRESWFGDRVVTCFAERPQNFDQVIRESAARFPDNLALVFGAKRITHREFDEILTRVAGNLAARSIGKGDRVGVLADNSLEFMYAVFGAVRAGAVAVPLGIRLQVPEVAYVIENCGLKAFVYDATLADRVPANAGASIHRFSIGGEAAGASRFETLLEPLARPFTQPDILDADLAMVMYTSGTTGRPKGAMLPHLAFVHSAMHFVTCLGHTPATRALLTIPASHISGLGAIVITMLRAGGCTVIVRGFNVKAFLETMAAERCTFSVMVPAMYKLCLMDEAFDKVDLSAWTVGIYGGAIMPPATIEALAKKLPKLSLVNGYGATETTSPAAVMPIGHTEQHIDSVGQVVSCGEIRIMDDEGREVPAGQSGELWIAGPMVAQGYWNNEQATRDGFTAGFWHSGDIGSIDEAGYVRILDRKKDMINRGGYKVFSAEVENQLSAHPDIVEAVVVPSPDAVLGERVHAFICARTTNLTGDGVRTFCAPLMADYKIPEIFTIGTEPLPRNANGKFEKAALREKAKVMAEQSPFHSNRQKG